MHKPYAHLGTNCRIERAGTMKENKNLTLVVYDRIMEMMINYDIVPGQRLVFVDLAEQLGVSRTPVNNALSILAKEGYLDFIPNQGYSVHKLTRDEAIYLYEIRTILEMGVVGKAIRQMTDEKLMILEQRKLDYEDAIKAGVHRKLFVLDAEFHVGIIEMINNPILAGRYRDICQRIFLRFRIENLVAKRNREIVIEHNELFEAVRVKDVEHTKVLVRTHYEKSKENLFAAIFELEVNDRKI